MTQEQRAKAIDNAIFHSEICAKMHVQPCPTDTCELSRALLSEVAARESAEKEVDRCGQELARLYLLEEAYANRNEQLRTERDALNIEKVNYLKREESLKADCEAYRGALECLMEAHRGVFTGSIAAAFGAGKTNFISAWKSAESALSRPSPSTEVKS